MNISTKCGIDPSAMWSAWGMAKLRAGDYPGARDKFSKCLKVSFLQIQVFQNKDLVFIDVDFDTRRIFFSHLLIAVKVS